MPVPGVPARTPAALKLTPAGRDPDSENVGAGFPVAVTVNELNEPTVKVVLLALVMVGDWLTLRVKLCVALGDMPFAAVMMMV